MMKPGARNLITDVDGIKIGNSEDLGAMTGVTAVVPEAPAVAAVDVRGGGPGTRETEALSPECLVERIDAIVLSGGSVYGLEAASGATIALARQGRGFEARGIRVPIVPSAILFDLANAGNKDWGDMPPYRQLGIEAVQNAREDFPLGNTGAGYGAAAGKLKGGLGSASLIDVDGIQVGAVIAVNPVGSVLIPGTRHFWAWALEQQDEFGGFGAPDLAADIPLDLPADSRLGENTTIGVVATNITLTKSEAKRIAIMAHDGFARAIRPVHTPFDGDSIFALSTERKEVTGLRPQVIAKIGAMAADCVARSVARAVYNAKSLGGVPGFMS